jgi:hypothetical protein
MTSELFVKIDPPITWTSHSLRCVCGRWNALDDLAKTGRAEFRCECGREFVLTTSTTDSASADYEQQELERMLKQEAKAHSACLCLPFNVYPDCPVHGTTLTVSEERSNG